MKNLLVAALLFVSALAFATQTETFVVSGGFGVKNKSTHVLAADWNRYFLFSDRGVMEAQNLIKASHCKSLGFQIDTKSPRFYSSAKNSLVVSLSKGTPESVCNNFYSKIIDVYSRSSPNNQAQIDIFRADQRIVKISITFEGLTTDFAE